LKDLAQAYGIGLALMEQMHRFQQQLILRRIAAGC
jgi:hypothetical protein